MSRWVTTSAVLVGGWAVAALLLFQALRLTLFDATEPSRTVAAVFFLIGMVLIPAAPAAAAWLAAGHGWVAAAWILGGLAAILAVTVAVWMVLFAGT